VTIGLLKDLGWQGTVAVPTSVSASDGTESDNVIVSWDSAANAHHYQIYRNTSNSLVGVNSLATNDLESPFNDLSAIPGTLYYYWVKACNDISCSDYSTPDSGWKNAGFLTAPTNVSAGDSIFTDKITVSWNETGGANYYKIYRNTDGLMEEEDLLFDNIIGNTFDDISVTTTESYYYMLKACNNISCSDFSPSDTGSLKTTKISTPSNVSASDGIYLDKVIISWNTVPGIAYYQVFRNTEDSVFGSTIIKNNSTANSFDDTSISLNLEYFYWVKACSNTECSVFSISDSGYLKLLVLDKHIYLPLISNK
jgi:fibronectin type 3 domain-containing protein